MSKEISFNDLPDEVCAQILSHVNGQPDIEIQKLLSLKNQRLSSLVSKYCGSFIILNGTKLIKIKAAQGRDSIAAALASSPQPKGDGDNKGLGEIPDKFPFVTKLSFVGPCSGIKIPAGILTQQLEGLQIHISSFSGNFERPLTLDLPNLRTLVIDSWSLDTSIKNEKLKTLNFELALGILEQNNFPKLSCLIVDLPFYAEKEGAVTNALAGFLSRHSQSLEEFCYVQGFWYKPQLSESDNSQDDDGEPGEVSLGALASCALALKKVFLRRLHIGLFVPQESDPLWINFFIQQNQLERVIFTGVQIPFPVVTVQVNQGTLTTVVIEVRENLDAETLKDCSSLQKLSLLGKMPVSEEEEIEFDPNDPLAPENFPNILNLVALPRSLIALRINMLKVLATDATQIISGECWKNLKELELVDVGNEGGLGVELKSIGNIFETKSLERFQIDYSLNRSSIFDKGFSPKISTLAFALRQNPNFIRSFIIRGELSIRGTYRGKFTPGKYSAFATEQDHFIFPTVVYTTGASRSFEEMEAVGAAAEYAAALEQDDENESSSTDSSSYITDSGSDEEEKPPK